MMNLNKGCIEIGNKENVYIPSSMMNLNKGCIEISTVNNVVVQTLAMNLNKGCIEMYVDELETIPAYEDEP